MSFDNEFHISETFQSFDLKPSESKDIIVSYTPDAETEEFLNYDTVVVETTCNAFQTVVQGQGVMPRITVTNFDFGKIKIDSLVCISPQNPNGIRIDNPGKDTLHIFGIKNLKAPFTWEGNPPEFPISIPVGKPYTIAGLCFLPRDSVLYQQDVIIENDAPGTDSIFTLKGTGTKKTEPISVEDMISEISPVITPNPVTDNEFYLICNFNVPVVTVNLYNLNGSCLKTLYLNVNYNGIIEEKISIPGLTVGIYYLKITAAYKVVIKKLVVI